jgi:hypothetical protein
VLESGTRYAISLTLHFDSLNYRSGFIQSTATVTSMVCLPRRRNRGYFSLLKSPPSIKLDANFCRE